MLLDRREVPQEVTLQSQSLQVKNSVIGKGFKLEPVLFKKQRAAQSKAQTTAIDRTARTRPLPFSSNRVFRYQISASGTTYSGNTSFPTTDTSYSPAVNFSLSGTVVIEPRQFAQNSNGRNVKDIGIIIGNDASLTAAGTLRYATNTLTHRYWGGTTNRPAIDTAIVQSNNRNRLTATVDSQWSRNDTTNLFSWNSSFISAPKQILFGSVTLQFSRGGRKISGAVVFYGNGFIESGAYAYAATFTGNLWR